MELLLDILAGILLLWAGIKIIDFIKEMFSIFGGDGVQPCDIMWWMARPLSIGNANIIRLPMLVGLFVWICLIWGTYWAVAHFI